MKLHELLDEKPFTPYKLVISDSITGDILTDNYNYYSMDYKENTDTLKELEVDYYRQTDYIITIYVFTC